MILAVIQGRLCMSGNHNLLGYFVVSNDHQNSDLISLVESVALSKRLRKLPSERMICGDKSLNTRSNE